MRVHAKYLVAMVILAFAALALDDQHQGTEVAQAGVSLNSPPEAKVSGATRVSPSSVDELVLPTDSSWKARSITSQLRRSSGCSL